MLISYLYVTTFHKSSILFEQNNIWKGPKQIIISGDCENVLWAWAERKYDAPIDNRTRYLQNYDEGILSR